MNLPELEAWFRTCVCGRVFSIPQAFSCHQRSCPKTRKRISAALAKAGEAWRAKKRQRIGSTQAADLSSNGGVTAELESNVDPLSLVHPQVRFHVLSAISFMNNSSGRC